MPTDTSLNMVDSEMLPAKSGSSTKAVKLDGAQSLVKTSSASKQSKKTKSDTDKKDKKRKAGEADEDMSDDESDVEFVNVDLDFFGFIESDYQAIKHLLTQLFSHDAKDLDIAGLTDHLIEQEEEVGSAVKTDGEEGDPLAFAGVVPLSSDKPYLTSLRTYLFDKAAANKPLQDALQNDSHKIGLVLHERLVNMPPQIVPPLFRILDEEMTKIGEPFVFTHLLFVSRVFLASPEDFPEEEDGQPGPVKKKSKKKKTPAAAQSETFLYHLEDEVLANLSEGLWTEYKYTNAPERGTMGQSEDFGVETRGRAALIPRHALKDLVSQTEKLFEQ